MRIVRSVRLFFREYTSDKLYELQVIEQDGLYRVHYIYGKRKTWKTSPRYGYKGGWGTQAAANHIFDSKRDEELKKRYQYDPDQTPTTDWMPKGVPAPPPALPSPPKPAAAPQKHQGVLERMYRFED